MYPLARTIMLLFDGQAWMSMCVRYKYKKFQPYIVASFLWKVCKSLTLICQFRITNMFFKVSSLRGNPSKMQEKSINCVNIFRCWLCPQSWSKWLCHQSIMVKEIRIKRKVRLEFDCVNNMQVVKENLKTISAKPFKLQTFTMAPFKVYVLIIYVE